MTTVDSPRTVQAVQISLDIVNALKQRRGAGVTELAEELEYAKGTIHSHLATLIENEYVVKEEGTYRLSLQFLELGQLVKDRINAYDAIRNELDDLAEECDELAQFATHEHGRIVYLYKARGENAVQTASRVGMREYMHCTALGKSMLSQLPEERVDEIVERHGLPKFTDQTITSKPTLKMDLESIRERGYAFDEEEKIEGLRCVSTPIQTNDGEILGAISVSGPSSRMEGDLYREEIPQMLERSANVIEINSQFG
ncbi:IclR family transcriptional regulator [Halomarina halobia]|uniref:IclR family transcriptional regulator n=1 Tax=Halomarina halobia TaxID=3033386 RepID=A0ABD6ACM5_9EURY|nr:IclR family transcriptional regulator [Halomarina sp. PSR21]